MNGTTTPSTTTTTTSMTPAAAGAGAGTASLRTPTSASGGAGKRGGMATKRTGGGGRNGAQQPQRVHDKHHLIVGCRASSSSRSSPSRGGLSVVPSIDVDSTGLVVHVRRPLPAVPSLPLPAVPSLPLPARPPISTLACILMVPLPLRIRKPVHPVKPTPFFSRTSRTTSASDICAARTAHRRVQRSLRFMRRRLPRRVRALDLYSTTQTVTCVAA
ncbi:hypothetical protein DFH09DRAFT_1307195 [Mycena vulgaris]|nr:hypothetical protein DFH09DRAFT_1307195 [Mycena vulgaris]